MAKNENNQKVDKSHVRCYDCAKGILHRYGNNPILAACTGKPCISSLIFPYEIEVAMVYRNCKMFGSRQEEATVQLLQHRVRI